MSQRATRWDERRPAGSELPTEPSAAILSFESTGVLPQSPGAAAALRIVATVFLVLNENEPVAA
jgi:hypothetical protein